MAVDTELDRFTLTTTELAVPHGSGKLVCVACAHRCKLSDGRRGVCLVRSREGEALRVPWGYTAGVAVDPIEKKPFFHVLPGSNALSFGMLGCDMHCDYCQNWFTSQTLRDPSSSTQARPARPGALVDAAVASGCRAVVSTYNEPLITAEWAHEVFEAARIKGLLTGFVSNGHGTPEVLDYLKPVTDLYKVDLKSFRERTYRQLGGHLNAVLDTIRGLHERGLWVEVVTLLVPGYNDEEAELRDLAGFLASVSGDIPWHVTAFHPDYRMGDRHRTSARMLARARVIGREQGLRFVYAGNLPGGIPDGENTVCAECGGTLVERFGFRVTSNRITPGGTCPDCRTPIPGVWS
ncbi:MAG: AmmeMemoRadiSam system radical SAM enzyme [Acidobacteria bacterium]|nr:AmmeMemoRadiSam system radical SAM enzyme [Acidobacteriota bacterium]